LCLYNCTENIAPDPAGGAYSAPPDLLAGLRGPTSKGREGDEGSGREGEGKEKGKPGFPTSSRPPP